ncbi:MAG: phenylacetate--CoA ligase family protein [Deltaproteobacteria bacterium]|nr:phenylacetate--CoA ligase family protein [Deltaproteobacteria bacterium]
MYDANRRYWDPRNECIPPPELRILQERRFRQAVRQAYDHTTFYRRVFDEIGLTPEDVPTLEDLNKIPLLDKYLLRDLTVRALEEGRRPFHELTTAREEDFVTIHTTSGTTGVPYTEPFTEPEFTARGFVASGDFSARGYWSFGLRPGDIMAHLWNLGGAMVGGGNHILGKGACGPELFLTIIPGHVGRTEEILKLLKAVKATAVISTPSYAQYLPEAAEKMGLSVRRDLHIRVVVCAGEPGPASVPGLREKLADLWGAAVFDVYGAPGVMLAPECEERCGFHTTGENVYVQVIDPETKEELPPGEMGTIVATKLGPSAMPFLRFNTEDRGAVIRDPCPCGRTHPRISSVPGRWDDVIKVKGFRLYPDTVEKVAKETPGCTGQFVIFLEKDADGRDAVRIQLEHEPGIGDLEAFQKKVSHAIRMLITLKADIELVPKGAIGAFVMKSQRVVDLRTEEGRRRFEEGKKLRAAKYFD